MSTSSANKKPNTSNSSESIDGSPSSTYTWCTLSGGFMSHWTQHYYDRYESTFHKQIWRFFEYFKLAIFVRVLFILSQYKSPNYYNMSMHLYLGTFAKYMGGPLHFTELIALFWSLSEAMMYHFCICSPRHTFDCWICIFLFLNQAKISSKSRVNQLHLNIIWHRFAIWDYTRRDQFGEHQQVETSSKGRLYDVLTVHLTDCHWLPGDNSPVILFQFWIERFSTIRHSVGISVDSMDLLWLHGSLLVAFVLLCLLLLSYNENQNGEWWNADGVEKARISVYKQN